MDKTQRNGTIIDPDAFVERKQRCLKKKSSQPNTISIRMGKI